jgi:hypothetical protein
MSWKPMEKPLSKSSPGIGKVRCIDITNPSWDLNAPLNLNMYAIHN